MKKIKVLLAISLLLASAGCNKNDHFTTEQSRQIFSEAEVNGRLAGEGFNRCLKFVHAWLNLADSTTGLIPRNINDSRSHDIWNAKDCAADNYPFMVLTCSLLDEDLFKGKMKTILDTETRLTSRIGALPDTWSFSKKGFLISDTLLPDIIFGSAEYVKDGLIPLTEWLGPSPWSERMLAIENDLLVNAPVKTSEGNIISDNPEVNGDMLQSLSRLWWMTGNRIYLDQAIKIGDYYLLGKNHPTRNFMVLRLRDHGCEIVCGLCELYAAVSKADPEKREAYKAPLYEMLDRILETGRNPDGLFYNSIDPVKGKPVDGGIADNFGYTLNGFYTIYLLDNIEKYREPIIQTLSVLNDKYRSFPWEGPSADGYADAIEGALNLYTREPVPSAANWIDSEIKVMWNKQQAGGIIEGWHGDGNFARTTIMYCLWKTAGMHPEPWREDLEPGAVLKDSTLYVSLTAEHKWNGKLLFDRKRHSEYLHMPVDWPRINQFPEYFAVDRTASYTILRENRSKPETVTGQQLLDGYPVSLSEGETLKLIIRQANK
jgi:hypothetical protein